MLFILKDMLESKTMLIAIIFIIGVSYIGGINNKKLEVSNYNSINVEYSVN